ncbi:MAG TPA: hypothetical protein VFS98_04230 [Methylomirabilota bacterium]|nr:hypothetical protein [Methylomirabilota bacterium]
MLMHSRTLTTTPEPTAELDRLGDEIAELSAHLETATARLLDLIRDFDARGGWNTGFRSCAAWLSWRVGLDLAARERVRVGRAGTAAHIERTVRGWRRVDQQAEAREAARQHANRSLHVVWACAPRR